MAKVRIHELAKDMGISSRELLDKLVALGLPVKNHMSTIPSQEVERIKNMVNKFEQKDEKEKVKEIKTEEKELNKPKTSKKTKPKFQHHGEENKENGLEKDYDEYAYIEDKDAGKLKNSPKVLKRFLIKALKHSTRKVKVKNPEEKIKGKT